MKTKIYLFFSFTFLIFQNSFGQVSSAQIDSLMTKAMKTFNVAGASIAVVKDGKIIIEKGYGVKSIETKKPVDEFTDFQIASNSKAFTTAAFLFWWMKEKFHGKIKSKNTSRNLRCTMIM